VTAVGNSTMNFTFQILQEYPPLQCYENVWLCGNLHAPDGCQRHRDSVILGPHPAHVRGFASVIMSPLPRILNLHLPKKISDTGSIRAWVRVGASLMVTSQSSNRASLKWLRQPYTVQCTLRTVSDLMEAHPEGRSLTRQTTQTTADTASIGWVTTPSTRADHPTLVQAL